MNHFRQATNKLLNIHPKFSTPKCAINTSFSKNKMCNQVCLSLFSSSTAKIYSKLVWMQTGPLSHREREKFRANAQCQGQGHMPGPIIISVTMSRSYVSVSVRWFDPCTCKCSVASVISSHFSLQSRRYQARDMSWDKWVLHLAREGGAARAWAG